MRKGLCWKTFGNSTHTVRASGVRPQTPGTTELLTATSPTTVAGHGGAATHPAGAAAPVARLMSAQQFGAGTPGGPAVSRASAEAPAPPDREQGDAAEAIAGAEAALAQQNSVSSHLDMQVVSAILNAHLNAVEGKEALIKLQRETEAAVRTRSDLDTPAGARDFQRFLIGKLRDIRAVVLNASLDDTSKSALMAAWTSLYDASKGEPDVGAAGATAEQQTDDLDAGWDPLPDSPLSDDPDLLPADAAGVAPPQASTTAPTTPTVPNFGAGSLPGLPPASSAGWAAPGGLPLSGLRGDSSDPALQDLDEEGLPESPGRPEPDADNGDGEERDGADASSHGSESPQAGPTTVTLPDGETVTAASPQLAAAINAAVGGAPIAEAFQQHGITIPPPGTPVPNPIDPLQVSAGDIGMLVDRHALALGPGKALLDGQIQHIATVSGPSFLGWEHPPAATATMSAPAEPDTPTPTRPATSSTN
jgi:Domain of unknown function (DUF4226)